MRIGVVGLAASHGWSYARMLRDRGTQFSAVWDPVRARLDRFHDEFGHVPVLTPTEMAGSGLDGAMICGVNSDHVADALPFLRVRVPVYINKPTVTTAEQLALLVLSAKEMGTPLFATSALRYAPAALALQGAVADGQIGRVLGAACTVCHSIEGYLSPTTRWQDDPALGGGAVINLGAHGMDLVTAVLGAGVEKVGAVVGVSTFTQTASEDAAVIALRLKGGVTASVQVVGGPVDQGYYLTVFGTDGTLQLNLTETVPEAAAEGRAPTVSEIHRHFGFDGVLDRFLDMCRTGVSPMAPETWQSVSRALLEARRETRG